MKPFVIEENVKSVRDLNSQEEEDEESSLREKDKNMKNVNKSITG